MMFRKNIKISQSLFVVFFAAAFLSSGSSASANDFYAYGPHHFLDDMNMPDIDLPVWGIGGYVEDYGEQPTWGDEIQYIYFIDGSLNAYKVQVWMTNRGGINDPTTDIDPFQHPYNPYHQGPIEPRHFRVKVGPVPIGELVKLEKDQYYGEFYANKSGVYFGPYGGIHKFDHNLNYIRQIAPAFDGMSLGYDKDKKTWYSGAIIKKISRQVWMLQDTNNDDIFENEKWEYIFTHTDYEGELHGGLEYVSGYLWISDMMSDIFGRYEIPDPWPEVETYPYSELSEVVDANVVGVGFGPNGNFWVSAFDANFIYEVGNNLYPVAEAGDDVLKAPPIIPIIFDASQSYHPDEPFRHIDLYEWDFDGDGNYDYSYTNGAEIVPHAYPAVLIDESDPDSIDWEATSKCYTAKLRVTDDVGNIDIDTRKICIGPPPWNPVADAGGTYYVRINEELCLDGSASFDPADLAMYDPDHPWYDEIESWEWDLDGDGNADIEAENPCIPWPEEGTHFVTLRVTDTQDKTDEDIAVVIVYTIHDVAVDAVITAQDADIHECDLVSIEAVVSNAGDFDEGNFSVKMYCDDVVVDEVIVDSLVKKENKTLTFVWDSTGASAGPHTLKICADIVPGEEDPRSNTDNNCWETIVEVDNMRWLIISSGDNGSVTDPGEGAFLYDDGTIVPVEATPDEHYHFVEWTGTAVDAGLVDPADSASANVTVEGICNLTLNANFAIDTHTLTTSSTFGGAVTIPGEGTFEYNYGEIVELLAEPQEPDHHFSRWIGDVKEPSSPSTQVEILGDTEVKAVFAIAVTRDDTVDSSDGQNETYFLPPEFEDEYDIWSLKGMDYYRNHYGDWSWTHTFIDEGDPRPSAITSATLEIEAWDVDDNEFNDIYALAGEKKVLLGTLDHGDEAWITTTIHLNAEALELLMEGTIKLTIDVSAEKAENENSYSHWRMAVRSSKLTVNFDLETE